VCSGLPCRSATVPGRPFTSGIGLGSADGTWERLLQRVQAEADAAGDIDWDVSVHSTSVRAHQHAAGAGHSPPPRVKGGSSQAVRTARIRAELVALLAEVVREVRRSAAHAGLHHKGPPERGRPLPGPLARPDARSAGRVHPVRGCHGTDPGAPPGHRPAVCGAGAPVAGHPASTRSGTPSATLSSAPLMIARTAPRRPSRSRVGGAEAGGEPGDGVEVVTRPWRASQAQATTTAGTAARLASACR
jgi:hypothetical protein